MVGGASTGVADLNTGDQNWSRRLFRGGNVNEMCVNARRFSRMLKQPGEMFSFQAPIVSPGGSWVSEAPGAVMDSGRMLSRVCQENFR